MPYTRGSAALMTFPKVISPLNIDIDHNDENISIVDQKNIARISVFFAS